MSEKVNCSCGKAPTLIFPCSGGSDVGEISDRAARKLSKEGFGKMYCLAGIGGHVNNMIVNAEAAENILAIDGCSVDCAKKTLEHAGFGSFLHIRVTDMGIEKGKSPSNDERVGVIFNKCKDIMEL